MGFLAKIAAQAKAKKQGKLAERIKKLKASKDVFGSNKRSVFAQMSSKPKGPKWDF